MSDFEVKYLSLDDEGGKYSALRRLLDAATGDVLTLSFEEIEATLGFKLPASARRYPAWWSNTEKGHSHARAWLRAGWQTSRLSLSGQRVTFVRVYSGIGAGAASGLPVRSASSSTQRGGSPAPRSLVAREPEKREGRIGLVGCVKKKLGDAAPAKDLYVSPLFRGRRAYVGQSCGRWFIISALHGVVRPDAVLEPYDVALNDASPSERRAWADKVLQQLDDELGSCAGLTFEIHAGANYVDFGLESGLRARGATVERPAKGLSMGRQLALYAGSGPGSCDPSPVEISAEESTHITPPTPPAPAESARVAPQWEERDAWTAIAALDESPSLVRACDWPADLTCLEQPGLYAWWVDEAGADDLTRGLGLELPARRIYAGQAGATWPPGKLPSDNTLGKRIGQMHLNGRVRGSTFRWTLAAILFECLAVQLRASMVITRASEEALSDWMCEHLSVAVHPHEDRDTLEGLERQLLGLLDPPLNLLHMERTPVRERLTELRRRISRDQ